MLRREQMAASVPEALSETPGVLVQQTAHGQGSPYLRGFTGFRTVALVDGIRLNNSTFRDGPNQYWSTIDALAITRLEVVKGPASVMYGSDAVGGTVNASCGGRATASARARSGAARLITASALPNRAPGPGRVRRGGTRAVGFHPGIFRQDLWGRAGR